jgi:subtilase family serine protease
VTVHNIGAAAAQNVEVCLFDPKGRVQARATIARIGPPADVKLKTATVELAARARIGDNWRVVIDPMSRIEEICETNNAAVVGDAEAGSQFVELPPLGQADQ